MPNTRVSRYDVYICMYMNNYDVIVSTLSPVFIGLDILLVQTKMVHDILGD